VETVVDLVQILARHVQAAVIAASAQREHRTAGKNAIAVGKLEFDVSPAGPHAFHVSQNRLDTMSTGLFLELADEIFLDIRRDLKLAGGCHFLRICEDRFALGKIDNGREELARLEHLEREPCGLCLYRRRHAGDAAPDDGNIHDVRVARLLAERLKGAVLDDVPHGPGAAIGGELEEGDATEITDDVDPADVGRAVLAHQGKLLHEAGGPLRVKPVSVLSQKVHSWQGSGVVSAI